MLNVVRKWLPDPSLYLDPHKKLIWFILGQRPIRRPGLEEIFSVVFVYFCWQTNQPANNQKCENKTSNFGGGKNDTPCTLWQSQAGCFIVLNQRWWFVNGGDMRIYQ